MNTSSPSSPSKYHPLAFSAGWIFVESACRGSLLGILAVGTMVAVWRVLDSSKGDDESKSSKPLNHLSWLDAAAFQSVVCARHEDKFSNPLDFSPSSMFCYRQGSFDFVRRDMDILPPQAVKQFEDLCEKYGLKRAYLLRFELVNFKKLLLRLSQEAKLLEKDLHQSVVFSHVEGETNILGREWSASGDLNSYHLVAEALQSCRGVTIALEQAREITKKICCLPRHPDVPRHASLRDVFSSSWAIKRHDQIRRR